MAQTTDNEPAAAPAVNVVNPPPPLTRLESIENRKGGLVIRGYTLIGTIGADDGTVIRVLALELKLPTSKSQEQASGIVIEIQNTGRFARTAISYIDAEEIDGLSGALESLSKLDRSATELADFDGHYRSNGDFEVGNLSQNGARFISLKSVQILRPTGEVIWTTARLPLARLVELQRHIAAAKDAIDRLKKS
jgi:hypothetical protein